MPTDLREVLHEAAAVPGDPLDLERVLVRGRRHRNRRRVGAVAGAFALVAAVAAGVLVIPGTATDQPRPAGSSPVRFDALPAGWTELPAPPQARHDAATAWTGERLLVWGGTASAESSGARADGFGFDSRTGRWEELAPSPLGPRIGPAAAWTGDELLVWGGGSPAGTRRYADGAGYDPERDAWRELPPAPISGRAPLSVWTGRELIVWGTSQRGNDIPIDGAAYDPATDRWRTIAEGPIALTDATAVWTGQEMVVFGAVLDSYNRADTDSAVGAAYDPATDRWRQLPDSGLSPQASTAAWNGEELIAWDYRLAAAAYDPAADSWRPLPDVPGRTAECWPASAPVGGEVFGEYCGAMVVYDRQAGRWRDVPRAEFAGWGRDPAARGWWFTLVPADPVVVLLGRVGDDAVAAFAYRPPA